MAEPALILVVDDSPIQCKIYASALKAVGYRVLTGENGRQGVTLALEHHPDLILMDLSMPEMDGISAVQELRRHPEMADVPILALTATTDADELEKALRAGYTDSVNKSEDRAAVLEKVRRQLA